jgi:chemotaxis protein MotB
MSEHPSLEPPGLVQIEGHTDNVPMSFGSRYRDNWDLSSARAASVADYLMDTGYVSAGSMVVKGLADTKAIASNDTALGTFHQSPYRSCYLA